MTFWIVACLPFVAALNPSLSLSRRSSSAVHSADRNCTGTADPPSSGPRSREYRRTPPPARSRLRARGLLEQVRVGEVEHVVQEADPPSRPVHLDRVQARVLGQEEHLVVDAEHRREVRVDHATVTDDDDVSLRMSPEDALDRAVDALAERLELLDTGRVAPHRLLMADAVEHVLVFAQDVPEPDALPLADVRLDQVVVLEDL